MAIGKCFSTRRLITLAKWPMVRLGDVCQLTMGQSPKTETYNGDSIGLPFFQGNTDFGKECPTARVWCKAPKKVALTGDILLSVRAPIGAVNTASCKCCIGRGIAALRPKSGALDVVYLKNLLRARRDALEALGTGSTFKAVTKKQLEDFLIPLPTVTCQNLLAKRFELIARLIEMRSHQLDMFGEIAKSRFIDMFGDKGYPPHPLSELSTTMQNGLSPSKNGDHHEKVLTLSAITQGNFDVSAWKEGLFKDDPPAGKRVADGCFYVCRGNGNKSLVGVGEYAPAAMDDLVYPDTMIAVRIDQEKVLLPYLRIAWKQARVREQIESSAKTTNGTYKINQASLGMVEVVVPPLSLQREFAAFAESVDKSQVAIKREIKKLETLKKALMQEYFG
ncbi:hypothetical protein B5F74_06965 [Collinsella sp. An271]|uniref:restriction endonuclease subunit S n=1 Tax=Collinsella sp. An271 TaxID=1965616 RepID=UPI000B3A036C|nr:restriction endonuclease subunit S [Collinsella sp. An271]OUO60581.1 hypothetical protein B5F74_06965 [Collinsella sp. An271]